MRKILLCLCLLPLLIAAKDGTKTSKAERRKAFISACNAEGDKQFTDPKTRRIFHEYCDCAGERVVNNFTEADWISVDDYTKNGKDSLVGIMMTPVIQPCLDELQRKIKAMNETKKN